MSAVLQTLKTAYEQEGMTIEEICQDQDLEPVAVKAGLMQVSSKYRKECGAPSEGEDNDGINFTKEERRQFKDAIVQLALSAESEKVRLAALVYARDDSEGRKDVKKLLGQGGIQINILEAFQNRLSQVRQKAIEA